jgi:DNA polymerase bacteriophage-type
MPSKWHIDFETRSEADLELVGAWAYAQHPSTKVLCMAVAKDQEEPVVYDLFDDTAQPFQFADDDLLLATNVGFEYCIWTFVLKHWKQPKLEQWRDIQAKLCAHGMPASLEKGALACGAVNKKDSHGEALIRYFCKPISTGEFKGEFRSPREFTDRYSELLRYCTQDVRTQQSIDLDLADISGPELQYWQCTYRTNIRGISIDRDLATGLLQMADQGRRDLDKEIQRVTNNELCADDFTNHAKITAWVRGRGVFIDGVNKVAVKNALDTEIPDDVRLVLQARQFLGKSSLAKLPNMLAESSVDGRVHFHIRYHGAFTGRDTSMGVQVQNLPRGEKGMDVDALIAAAKAGDYESFKANSNGLVLAAASSCIRGCFAAESGKQYVQCDYAAIEPRLAAWFCNEREMLANFRAFDKGEGPDIYQVFAARFYNEPDPYKIKGERRNFGKVSELQLLYQSGATTLRRAAKDMYGVVLDEETAERAVREYRRTHPRIKQAWSDLFDAACTACNNPETVYVCGRVAFRHDKKHLFMRLPCGRKTCFPYAYVTTQDSPYGKRPTIEHMGIVDNHWTTTNQHGGSLFNAVIQGLGGSLIRHAAIQLESQGINIVLRVHDELIGEVSIDIPDPLPQFKSAMLSLPEWGKDIPVNGEGWIGLRYKKG